MKKYTIFLAALIFTLLTSCNFNKSNGEGYLGTWYVKSNELIITKNKNNYIIDIGDKKLLGKIEDDILIIENKGAKIKAFLTPTDELVIDGETATRTNPREEKTNGLFDEKETVIKEVTPAKDVIVKESSKSFGNSYITGENVLFRKNHSTKSKVFGKFKNRERVQILDEYSPNNSREAITNKQIYLYNSYGKKTYTLPRGKAVEIVDDNDEEYQVMFQHSKYGKLFANIRVNNLEFISGDLWYKVKKSNGKIGWVYSKFVKK